MPKMLIGLVQNLTEDQKFSNNANYYRWLKTLGTVTMIDPFQLELEDVDLLVLPGGSDINPRRYMQFWHPACGLPQRSLEFFDEVMLPQYIDKKQRILGICRGMQSLNVLFGGTLHPHVVEPTSVTDGSFVHYIKYKDTYLPASSNHHQAADVIGEGFEVIMRGYGVKREVNKPSKPDVNDPLQVEGILHNELPILGVQFHPEKQHGVKACAGLNEEVEKLVLAL